MRAPGPAGGWGQMADNTKAPAWGAAHFRVLTVLYLAYFANIMGRTAIQVCSEGRL